MNNPINNCKENNLINDLDKMCMQMLTLKRFKDYDILIN